MVQTLFGPGPKRWRQLAFVLAFVALAAMGVFYTRWTQRESDHRWCELLTSLTTGPPPPAGPSGDRARDIAQKLTQLRDDLGC